MKFKFPVIVALCIAIVGCGQQEVQPELQKPQIAHTADGKIVPPGVPGSK